MQQAELVRTPELHQIILQQEVPVFLQSFDEVSSMKGAMKNFMARKPRLPRPLDVPISHTPTVVCGALPY